MVYGFTGLTYFEELSKVLTGIGGMGDSVTYNGILIGIMFITVSLLLK